MLTNKTNIWFMQPLPNNERANYVFTIIREAYSLFSWTSTPETDGDDVNTIANFFDTHVDSCRS